MADRQGPLREIPRRCPAGILDLDLWQRAIGLSGYFRRANLTSRSAQSLRAISEINQEPDEDGTVVADKARARKAKARKENKKKLENQQKDALRLLANGLDEESPFQSSKYALKKTPAVFQHRDLPAEHQIILRPHQLHAIGKINHIINAPTIRPNAALLNYDMGIGKTYIQHGLMHLNKSANRTMVLILPINLIEQWRLEIETRAIPPLQYCVYDKNLLTAQDMQGYELVITSFNMVRANYVARKKARAAMKDSCNPIKPMPISIRSRWPLLLVEWSAIFVDECADITNVDAIVTKAVSALKGKRRVGSSGTPVQNDYHNLHALAVFLGLEPWNDWKYFKKTIMKKKGARSKAAPLQGMQNDFLAVSLRSNMLVLNARDEFDGEPLVDFPAAVNHVLRHGMSDEEGKVQEYTRISWDSNYKAEQKRRKYQDLPYVESLDDFERLPAWGRSRQGLVHYLLADEKYTPTAKATPEKRKALDDHQKEMIGMLTGELFWDATTEDDTTISPGKAECDKMLAKDIRAKWRESTRIQTLLSSLEERLMDMSRKVLIFDESARVLNVVGIALEESGLNYYYIHGGVAKDERTKLLAEFSNSKKQDPVRIFLITTKCGGVGLDQLKVADTVYIMTPSHNPFLEAQCIARASRMGNNKEVNVFRFFTPDSIEERISHIQDEKKLKASNLFDPRKASNEGIKKMMKWESGKDFLEMLKSMSDDEEPRRPRAKKEDQRRPKSSDEDEDEEGKATSQPSRSMSPRTHEHTDSGPPSPRDSDDASNSEGHENLDQNREPSPPIFEQSTESNLTSPRDSNDDGNGVHTTNDDVGSEVEDLPSNEALNFEALFTTHDQRSNTSNPSHPRYPQRDGLGFSNQLASPFLVPSTNPSQTHAWNQRHIFQFPPALRPWEHGQFPGTEDYVNFGPMNGGYRNSVEPAPDNLLGFMDEPGFPTHTEMIGGSVQEDYDLMGDWKMEETDNDRALRMIREEGRDARRARGGR